jgi:ubiquitin-like 1-activating enzyme E1 B
VINALDNVEARNHTNRMCFNLGIPLVEAGTDGYDASMQSIKKGFTECYQCKPPAKEKTYPMCTIR